MTIVRAGAPLHAADRVAVLVHGRGQDERVMLDVAERLALPNIAYLLPVAPGGSWYPGRYFDPPSVNGGDLQNALAAVQDATSQAPVDPRDIVLGGFSQGACVIAEFVARHPCAWAGAAILTGTLLGPDGEQIAPGPVPGISILCAYSRHDAWIDPGRAHATAQAFAAAGARVTEEIYEDRGHLISERAVAALRRLLTARAAE